MHSDEKLEKSMARNKDAPMAFFKADADGRCSKNNKADADADGRCLVVIFDVTYLIKGN